MSVITGGRSTESAVGFCPACGIVREDLNGVPISDCVCTAKHRHADDCFYVKCCGRVVDTGVVCAHGLEACEEHDCTCGLVHVGARGAHGC